jgi:hypothetical protein
VLTHLNTQETRSDPAARQIWKLRLIKSLYDQDRDGVQIRLLFKFIDWMLELPRELDSEVSLELAEFERERKMPYVTSIERTAREEGMAAAKADALLRILTKKLHGAFPADLQARIRATDDLAKLDSWIDNALEAADLDGFRRTCGI